MQHRRVEIEGLSSDSVCYQFTDDDGATARVVANTEFVLNNPLTAWLMIKGDAMQRMVELRARQPRTS